MHLFYTPDLSSDEYTLSEEESKHAVKVLRLTEGEAIQLIDGKGGFYTAEIIAALPKRCTVKVISKKEEYGKRNHFLHIAVAPTKSNDRFEWFLEKATEIGIDEITPVECERSERVTIKTERLNKIITSAVKQSLTAYHPVLNEVQKFFAFLKNFEKHKADKFIAHCTEESKRHLFNVCSKDSTTIILIGPEGDFSLKEIEAAHAAGFKSASLGEKRLRTETAALAACHIVNLKNEVI